MTPLSDRAKDLLAEMTFQAERWRRPMDLGATDASWHSGVLSQLVKRGLVERRERGSSHSFQYRLTEAGRKLALELREQRYPR